MMKKNKPTTRKVVRILTNRAGKTEFEIIKSVNSELQEIEGEIEKLFSRKSEDIGKLDEKNILDMDIGNFQGLPKPTKRIIHELVPIDEILSQINSSDISLSFSKEKCQNSNELFTFRKDN
ncbi:unnamed protein product [Blepharisma stoltei]|uniref:Uncharacterized protein n=1 Tax=Blepharisma stoltei TaxID=1481888 RepID=A0AAU9IAU1_9CILI|nr:unnamed protein product [Blepharisma stoltei]